jgi:hypothetical protein
MSSLRVSPSVSVREIGQREIAAGGAAFFEAGRVNRSIEG